MKLNTIEELVEDIRLGKMVILMDDEDRENEGDLVMAAEKVRAEDINFMATHARGLVCLTLTEQRCRLLDLPLMVHDNREQYATNFTLSIEAAEGVTTGISAGDRAKTVRAAVARNASPKSIVQPGHIFPLMARPGGVLSRAGHTEAGCDLSKLAGYEPAAAIVEIMNQDGTMARRPDLEQFAEQHDLKIGTIADLIHYRSVTEKTVECINQRSVKTRYGQFSLSTYRDVVCGDMHFAFAKGEISEDEPTLVRVHLLDTARDLLSIEKQDAEFKSWTFHDAMVQVEKEDSGVVVLICYEENSSDIENRIESMLTGVQQTVSQDTVYRQVGTGAQILRDMGVKKMRLMSAPMKFSALSGFDLEVVDVISNPE
ncbi:MAG: 3,4-dihydroxy 2-butanone 4-phosphate synthase/GTP cyclohydrolase II [Candidatus Endobugula sp.]|jgi:3,4-dihydroxy 2-butanone 4-phosphate synthase/GTP cyclohydrolase II